MPSSYQTVEYYTCVYYHKEMGLSGMVHVIYIVYLIPYILN